MSPNLTPSAVMERATELLEGAGYTRAGSSPEATPPVGQARLFEDPYGIVALTVWENWDSLQDEWTRAQAWLVELISERIPHSDAKTWDGYLVLFLPGEVPAEARREIDRIRHDTSRVRKLVEADLSVVQDIERALSPLLPLVVDAEELSASSVLEQIPELIAADEVPREIGKAVTDAFRDGRPLLEAIHLVIGETDAPG